VFALADCTILNEDEADKGISFGNNFGNEISCNGDDANDRENMRKSKDDLYTFIAPDSDECKRLVQKRYINSNYSGSFTSISYIRT